MIRLHMQKLTGRMHGQETPLAPKGSSQLVDLHVDAPLPSAPAFKAVMRAADAAFAARVRPRVVSTSVALTWVATGPRAADIMDGDARIACTSLPVSPSATRPAARSPTCEVRGGGAGQQGWWRRLMPRPTPRSCLW
jgi:hypothetical protein